MAYTDYLETLVANFWKGTAFPAPPPNLFISIHNGDPTDTVSSGVDVTGTIRGAAGRLTVANSAFNAPVTDSVTIGRVIRNANPLDFGEAQNTATVTHFIVWDAATGGNPLVVVPIAPPTPRTVTAGTQLVIPAGALQWGQTTAPESQNGLTTFAQDRILNWFRGTNPPVTPTLYFALYNGSPGLSGTGGAEQTGSLYPARVAVSASTGFGPVTQVANAAQFENVGAIDFGSALVTAFITHSAVFDAATGGNMLWFNPLGVQTTYTAGTPLRFLPGGYRRRIL